MENSLYRWSNEQLRTHIQVLDEHVYPHIILQNATYLHTYTHQWITANIWIYDDRIVYVGEKLPSSMDTCEVVECRGKYIVPGYIEPHAHPYQLYNPITLAEYAGQFGTTTFVSDNLTLFLELPAQAAFALLDEYKKLPASMYWWCRFDAQTELPHYETLFHTENITAWLRHEAVLQGGELTAWPQLLHGDNTMLSWIQEAKRLGKKIEGHFPGASERTLAKLMLLGADCDHEAMTGHEAFLRLMQGYTVSLRHSSIRPDLRRLLPELLELGVRRFDRFLLTSDGSHPFFYEHGMTDELIRIALDCGVPVTEAYNMAGYNIARYYNMEHLHGSVATGRIANLNILENQYNPAPVSVLAKGKWVKRDGKAVRQEQSVDWPAYQMTPLSFKWTLQEADFDFPSSTGIHLLNNVITRPYESDADRDCGELSMEHEECFLMMVARDGSWRVNTLIKGFARQLGGFASSYSGTGDILLIGKRKADMLKAFRRMQELGGGIVLVDQDQILHEIPLPLRGIMSDLAMDALIRQEKQMIQLLQERGFLYNDPAFTLLFLSATHLPFIRITPSGLYDVKRRETVALPVAREQEQRRGI